MVESYLHAGERVEDKPVARVATIDPLRVELIVPASYIGRINIGDTLAVKPEFDGAKPLSARVALLDRVIDAASNTFRVRADLPNPGNAIPAGLRCRVDITAIVPAAERAAGVPAAAEPAVSAAIAPTAAPTALAAVATREKAAAYVGLAEAQARVVGAEFKGTVRSPRWWRCSESRGGRSVWCGEKARNRGACARATVARTSPGAAGKSGAKSLKTLTRSHSQSERTKTPPN